MGLETGSINPFSANFIAYNAVRNTGRHLGEAGRQIARGNPIVAARVTAGVATSALSGDLLDSRNSVDAQSTGVSQNGIKTDDDGARDIAKDATDATGQPTHSVQNGTHFGGLGDLVQCVSDALGIINTPSLNSADAKREIAQNHGSGTLESTAHSQGASVDRGASVLLDGEGINERTSYQGFGGQITPRDGVYKDTYNLRGPSFTDALVTHADPRGWLKQENYQTSPSASGHGWENYGKGAIQKAEAHEILDDMLNE